jgi:hypothetical protein
MHMVMESQCSLSFCSMGATLFLPGLSKEILLYLPLIVASFGLQDFA